MINLKLNKNERSFTILAMGAHCDDIEIGCGGTLLTIMKNNPHVKITWVVFSSTDERINEAIEGAKLFCNNSAVLDYKVLDFKDGFLPYHGENLKNVFEELKREVNPDLIFSHYQHDLHQDHRLISELTWNTFRNHLILEYEIPKWDGDLSSPNFFIHLDKPIAMRKIEYLQQVYHSQKTKAWFSDDLFWALMRIRGMESNSPSDVAEGFYLRKAVLNI